MRKTLSRHNLPLAFIEPLEEDANREIEVTPETDETVVDFQEVSNAVRLAFIMFVDGSPVYDAIFYKDGEHHSIKEYTFEPVSNDPQPQRKAA